MKTVSNIMTIRLLVAIMMTKNRLNNLYDSLGIFTSAVCLVHCLGLPLAVLLLPSLGIAHDESTHLFLAGWVLLFALFALRSALKKENWHVVCFILCGLSAVLIATFSSMIGLSTDVEAPLITVGNLLVIAGHYQNRQPGCC